jgi:hypothetical protein
MKKKKLPFSPHVLGIIMKKVLQLSIGPTVIVTPIVFRNHNVIKVPELRNCLCVCVRVCV